MIINPRIRQNICINAHPVGCASQVRAQINYVKNRVKIDGPKKVLVIGASNGDGGGEDRVGFCIGCRNDRSRHSKSPALPDGLPQPGGIVSKHSGTKRKQRGFRPGMSMAMLLLRTPNQRSSVSSRIIWYDPFFVIAQDRHGERVHRYPVAPGEDDSWRDLCASIRAAIDESLHPI